MKRDFTLSVYRALLESVRAGGYRMIAYEDFIGNKDVTAKQYILRHDVDDLPERSVAIAAMEKEAGARGTFYFRIVAQSNHPNAIEKIAAMGHEIGYHYEDLTLCNGNYEKAYEQYLRNLNYFRKYYPVKTICMHGSPLSRWDNKLLWNKYDYHEQGIIAEPYFDTDFNKVLYITDTGRRWNGSSTSIRDKVKGLQATIQSTEDLIKKINSGLLPDTVMQNIHPQRWTDSKAGWLKELIYQNAKNLVKRMIASKNNKAYAD